jgi:hypothetical protein
MTQDANTWNIISARVAQDATIIPDDVIAITTLVVRREERLCSQHTCPMVGSRSGDVNKELPTNSLAQSLS